MNRERKIRSRVLPAAQRVLRPAAKRPRVLVVLHSDGWVEVFGDDIDVHVSHRLHVTDAVTGVLAEQYLDATLPRRFRDLYVPVKIVAFDQCEQRTAEDELCRRQNLAIVKECRAMASEQKETLCPSC